MARKPPQKALFGASGTALWQSVNDVLVLDSHEEKLLAELCRTADACDELQKIVDRDGVLADSSQGVRAHPALQELRQQRVAFARLIAALGLPSGIRDAAAQATRTKPRQIRGVYRIAGA